jgi:RNA polymerase sigma-70 factor (subfamily 1)
MSLNFISFEAGCVYHSAISPRTVRSFHRLHEVGQVTTPIPSEWDPSAYRGWMKLCVRAFNLHPAMNRRLDDSDLVQEALLKVHASAECLRATTEGERRAYLKVVLRNVLIDAIRKNMGPEGDVFREEHFDQAWSESVCRAEDILEGRDPTPSSHLRKLEEGLEVLNAIDQLTEPQREIIILTKLDGMSVRDVAARMGRGKSQVAKYAAEGLRELRKLLEARLGESGNG